MHPSEPNQALLSRRGFLQNAAALATAAATLPALGMAPEQPNGSTSYPELGTLIPDEGWRLWVDRDAAWKDDEIFLPEEVSWRRGVLHGGGKPLPVHEPTGGWAALNPAAGIGVVLPTSVEQHFWGKFGFRPYTAEEYRYAPPATGAAPPADDAVPQNGSYFGVSWFFRPVEIPAEAAGKRILLHCRGAHLRAEVYLNHKLCGYSIMEELPFEADLSAAANPGGANLLAIRITNPFGRFDWVDGLNAKWGAVSLFRSHGFGALDRGLTISTHPGHLRIVDAWALNRPEAHELLVRWIVETPLRGTQSQFAIRIMDPVTGRTLQAETRIRLTTADGKEDTGSGVAVEQTANHNGQYQTYFAAHVVCPEAEIWDLDTPRLYHLVIDMGEGETRTLAAGFRWFSPEGLGTDALFRLNGRRIRIYTSISWGFWGLNGMFPVPELALKEVTAAKTLGLNCLNFHRNLAKEDVLRRHDELGMLRYMEPGGGKLSIGRIPRNVAPNAAGIVPEEPKTASEKFAQRYMFTKCVEMVKAFRSHTSVIEYCLQNEIGADLHNPATLAVLDAMHREDPSRCVVLNDGFVARGAAQAWYGPYDDTIHRSDTERFGGWWNNHQGAGDQWYDSFYQSPAEYTYRAPYREVLTEFGEMEGCARPDLHQLMIEQITQTYKRYGADSYDLQDHREIVAGYAAFLSRWGFERAFPSPEAVFLAAGKTCYESWMNYVENARISDDLDFAAISGWESTAIENHSGIVDNLRNFKSDPRLIAGSLLPVRPIAKQRELTVARGTPAVFDLYLANDTPAPVSGTLRFSMVTPGGKLVELTSLPAPTWQRDRFSYLLQEHFTTPPLTEEGLYRFRFSSSAAPASTQTRELWVTATDLPPVRQRTLRVGAGGVSPALRKQLGSLAGVEVVDFAVGGNFDVLVSSGITADSVLNGTVGETTGEALPLTAAAATAKPQPGRVPEPGESVATTQLGKLPAGMLDAVRAGTPLLAIPQEDSLSEGVARELAGAGAFQYAGAVGAFRAPWMGNWYLVREHDLFAGLPVNQAMGGFYQARGRQSDGLLVEGEGVEIVVAYSRDHDRHLGAGCFTCRVGTTPVVYSRIPEMQKVTEMRYLRNCLTWLANPSHKRKLQKESGLPDHPEPPDRPAVGERLGDR